MYQYHEINLQIETERLLLRPFIESDAEKVALYCNDEALNKGVAGLPIPYTIDHALTWFNRQKEENYSFFDFAIVDKTTSELLGSISLSNRVNQRVGELGYWIGRKIGTKVTQPKPAKQSFILHLIIKTITKSMRVISYPILILERL